MNMHISICFADDKEICRLFLIKKPELLYTNGFLILDTWADEGKVWPFEYLLTCNDIIPNIRRIVFNIFLEKDPETGKNIFHTLARSSSTEESIQIAKLLMNVYMEETSNDHDITTHASSSSIPSNQLFPWLLVTELGSTPLLTAIAFRNEDFASYILSLDNNAIIESPYNCLHLVVMAANPQASYVPKQNKLEKIALEILDVIIHKGWNHLIVDGDEAGLAMHKAPFCGG